MGVRVRERNGCWWIFIQHQNKRKAKKIGPGPEGAKLARQLADKLMVRLAYGEDLDTKRATPTLREYAESWLRQVHVTKKPGTADVYARHMRRVWLPALGKYPLDHITRAMVKRVLIQLQEQGFRRNTVASILTALQGCYAEARNDELVEKNPAERHLRSLAPSPKIEREVFTPAELDQVFAAAIERWPEAYVKILILARTGLREGEMLALQVHDVDFQRQQIWVRRTWGSRNTSRHGHCINIPKSGKWRWVDMSPQLMTVVASYLAAHPHLTGEGWLFPGAKRASLPMHPTAFQYIWRKILEHGGLRHRPPHCLRHTYVSLLLASGATMRFVQDQLGHSSINTTMDIYSHMMPDRPRSEVGKLDSFTPIADPYQRNLSATSPNLKLVND